MKKKAVLFDMDGTLIDSEKIYQYCWKMALQTFGYCADDEITLQLRSLGRPYAEEFFREQFGEDCDYQKIRNKRIEIMNDLHMDAKQKPGAVRLLDHLTNRNVIRAVVTATEKNHAINDLTKAGLISYFDTVISARMVERGKPAGDVYLEACRQLGLKPDECIAIEDSPNGVKSAYRAGCTVIMVKDLTGADEELKKMIYAECERLDEVIDLLEDLL